jgi:hypothetical protein
MPVRKNKLIAFALTLLIAASGFAAPAAANTTRIKDIVDIEGVRDNMLIGYGLVVGLNGTGDSLNNSPFTEQSLIAMLERLGVNTRGQNLNTGNVAAVMVTGTLRPFSNQGTRIDVTVSALGDAKSLQGGTLLVTPLMDADGAVYAVAQGSVNVGGFSAEGAASTVTKNVPTAGRIPEGARGAGDTLYAREQFHRPPRTQEPGFHHCTPHRAGHQQLRRQQPRRRREFIQREADAPDVLQGQHRRPHHGCRTAAGRARPGRTCCH